MVCPNPDHIEPIPMPPVLDHIPTEFTKNSTATIDVKISRGLIEARYNRDQTGYSYNHAIAELNEELNSDMYGLE